LATELAAVLGAANVAAVDPSPAFVDAARERLADVDVRLASAEDMPFENASFDHALAQLVVNFMADARAGVVEMRRVVRPGGRVTAATWDYAGGMTFLRRFWDAAIALDSSAAALDEIHMRFCTAEELAALWAQAGLSDVRTGSAVPRARYADFDDLWRPIEGGIGPSGVYVRSLSPSAREALRDEYRRALGVPDGPFELAARAWLVTGVS
jgi:SAM-dependent methyltransferase